MYINKKTFLPYIATHYGYIYNINYNINVYPVTGLNFLQLVVLYPLSNCLQFGNISYFIHRYLIDPSRV